MTKMLISESGTGTCQATKRQQESVILTVEKVCGEWSMTGDYERIQYIRVTRETG